jgi:hypothetical protein
MRINQRIAEGSAATPNRWLIAIAGAVLMLTIGTIYSWAIFTQPPLVAFRCDLTVTTWAYAIENFSRHFALPDEEARAQGDSSLSPTHPSNLCDASARQHSFPVNFVDRYRPYILN